MTPSSEQLRSQLTRAKATGGMYSVLHDAAQKHGVPFAYVLAVASRETNIVNEIGDCGHGVGVLQIDTQHQLAADAAANGTWRTNPAPLVDFGVQMLAENLAWARETYPAFAGNDGEGWSKIAAAAYNAGRGGVEYGIRDHGDADYYTTGRDYGYDVVCRTRAFSQLLAGE